MKSIPLKSNLCRIELINYRDHPHQIPRHTCSLSGQMIDVFSRAVPAKKFDVYLFGSRARGDEEEGSDADLAISGDGD